MKKIEKVVTVGLSILGVIRGIELVRDGIIKISSKSKKPECKVENDDINETKNDEQSIIDGLTFVRTSKVCPEQYDVLKDGEQVGYVRLRWGELRCDYKHCGGETIYIRNFPDKLMGSFNTEGQRMGYLSAVAHTINEHMSQSEQ